MHLHLFFSRGRGIRTPVNGFGDRRTATVLFPCMCCWITNELYYSKKQFKRQGKNAILWKKVCGHAILFWMCCSVKLEGMKVSGKQYVAENR